MSLIVTGRFCRTSGEARRPNLVVPFPSPSFTPTPDLIIATLFTIQLLPYNFLESLITCLEHIQNFLLRAVVKLKRLSVR